MALFDNRHEFLTSSVVSCTVTESWDTPRRILAWDWKYGLRVDQAH